VNGLAGTYPNACGFLRQSNNIWRTAMRSALLWLIGVPIPLILLLAFCTHHL